MDNKISDFQQLSPILKGENLRLIDESIKDVVRRKSENGLSDDGLEQLRQEFEIVMADVEQQFTPAEIGSLWRVFDEAVAEAPKLNALPTSAAILTKSP